MSLKTILTALLPCVLLLSCNPEKKAIKEVAYKYSDAMANYRVAEAESYATSETRSTTLVMARRLIEKVGDEYIASDTPADIDIKSVEITSDTTAFVVYHKETPLKEFTDTLQLRKRDGQWQAHALIPVVKSDSKKSAQGLNSIQLNQEKDKKIKK